MVLKTPYIYLQHDGTIADVCCHGTDVIVGVGERLDTSVRHQTISWLHPDKPTPGGGDTDRSSGVGTQSQVDLAGYQLHVDKTMRCGTKAGVQLDNKHS